MPTLDTRRYGGSGLMEYRNSGGLWVPVAGTAATGKVATVQSDGTVAWETPSGGGGGSTSIGSHAYWGLFGLTSASTLAHAMSDLQFRATVGGTAQTVSTATASSAFSGSFLPANATDGSTATAWASATPGPAWFVAQFASAVAVLQIAVRARTDAGPEQAPTGLLVAYSDDGTSFVPVVQILLPAFTLGQQQTFAVPATRL